MSLMLVLGITWYAPLLYAGATVQFLDSLRFISASVETEHVEALEPMKEG